VAIVDPKSTKDKGVQGYLKLSVTVVGPGSWQCVLACVSNKHPNIAAPFLTRCPYVSRFACGDLVVCPGDKPVVHTQADIEAKDLADEQSASSKGKKGAENPLLFPMSDVLSLKGLLT
jgi:hypothetical protein